MQASPVPKATMEDSPVPKAIEEGGVLPVCFCFPFSFFFDAELSPTFISLVYLFQLF